jgi:quercetin dioxygenase-like cupin family protein
MDAKSVVAELEQLYPGKLIKQLPEQAPAEIICEFDPGAQHPEWSLAVAVIDRSAAHYHNRMTEVYQVIKGTLTLYVDSDEFTLYEGQQFTVTPGRIHWATGDATWVEVYCTPAYTSEDHILST